MKFVLLFFILVLFSIRTLEKLCRESKRGAW